MQHAHSCTNLCQRDVHPATPRTCSASSRRSLGSVLQLHPQPPSSPQQPLPLPVPQQASPAHASGDPTQADSSPAAAVMPPIDGSAEPPVLAAAVPSAASPAPPNSDTPLPAAAPATGAGAASSTTASACPTPAPACMSSELLRLQRAEPHVGVSPPQVTRGELQRELPALALLHERRCCGCLKPAGGLPLPLHFTRRPCQPATAALAVDTSCGVAAGSAPSVALPKSSSRQPVVAPGHAAHRKMQQRC